MRKNLASFDSRQEIRTGGFELQHKRDTYLKAVELHHHDFYEIYFLVSGDVNYVIEGRLHPIKPGDLLLISPRELHQVSIQTDMAPYERYVLWLKPSEVQRLSGSDCDLEQGLNPANPQYRNQLRLSEDQRNMVRYLMEAVLRESEEEHFGSDMLKESYLQQLLVHINRFFQRGRPGEGNGDHQQDGFGYCGLCEHPLWGKAESGYPCGAVLCQQVPSEPRISEAHGYRGISIHSEEAPANCQRNAGRG